MNQELQLQRIDDEAFGQLIEMPRIYERNQLRVVKAKEYSASLLAKIKDVNIEEIDGQEMEALMIPIRECRALAAEAVEEIKGERMPHTRKMDAIKSVFTGQEGELQGVVDLCKAEDNRWETEKLRRQRAAQKKVQDDANKAEDKVRIRSTYTQAFNNEFTRLILAEILGMNKAFNAKTADELPAYGEALLNWVPEIDEALGSFSLRIASSYFKENELLDICHEVRTELLTSMLIQWTARVNEDKVRLIDMIPSRIAQLQEAAAGSALSATEKEAQEIAQQAQQEAEIISQVQQMGQSMQDAAVSAAQGETMDAVAAIAAKATPVVAMASGTKVKQKYKVTSHQGMVALITAYVKHDMKNLTVDELNTKFSFVRTACDKRLNQAPVEIIESTGLEVIEDVSTRRTSKAI
jgi:hypothetical protein